MGRVQTTPSKQPERRSKGQSDFPTVFNQIVENVERVIQGKDAQIRVALACLLAEGHLLIDDVPGVGKTLLAKSIARSIACTWRRIQFTPDLLPTDVTGVNIFDQETHTFQFHPGAIFANIVLGDEINRASPKTQSALLEAMEERQVTIDGTGHPLDAPFMVLATQNPLEHEGTYPLPFAQLDRFLVRLSLGYPDAEAEHEMLRAHALHSALDDIEPVCDARTVRAMIGVARGVHVADSIRTYIVEIANATRGSPDFSLGASPRASLALLRVSRVRAAAEGRDYVLPDDVKGLAAHTLAHRLVPSADAEMSGRSVDDALHDAVASVSVPVGS